jgi:Uma2 family endonuclease
LKLSPEELREVYQRDAEELLRSLPLEHFMQSTWQSKQYFLAVQSFEYIHCFHPEIQCFSELLIQYPIPGGDPRKPGQVVPDVWVLIHHEPIKPKLSYMVPLQPVLPTLVMEWTCKTNTRKDYADHRRRYERDLKVPYYLLFHPEDVVVEMHELVDGNYRRMEPDSNGRYRLPLLEVELGLVDKYIRFWHRGELAKLGVELYEELNERKLRREAIDRERIAIEKCEALEAELAALRAQLNTTK